jgi:hypothetical protein
MVIKGILEQITTSNVNLVNADLLAKNRGLRIIESFVPAEGTVRPLSRHLTSSSPCLLEPILCVAVLGHTCQHLRTLQMHTFLRHVLGSSMTDRLQKVLGFSMLGAGS